VLIRNLTASVITRPQRVSAASHSYETIPAPNGQKRMHRTDAGEAVIEVAGLRRKYGGFEAVGDVRFRVHRGELFALLGTNGAGKTTTIEVLEGLQHPARVWCVCSALTPCSLGRPCGGAPE
jgi:ABC-type molybdenum transport system ATPase subunit/photorepair protein PhrA